jgi:hypothetical protein
MDRRAEIEGWIAKTRQNQKKLGVGVACAAVVAIGLMLWRVAVGGVALGIVAIVALCGFWVTASHLADWQDKLDQLDRPLRRVGRRAD